MPTYVYECDDPECADIHEEFHTMSEDPEILCPKCGHVCSRNISGGGKPVFKGAGFYENDYKKKPMTRESLMDDCREQGL